MMRRARMLRLLALSGASLCFAGVAGAQEDVAAAIAELRADNQKLAARIAELEREVAAQRTTNGQPEPLPVAAIDQPRVASTSPVALTPAGVGRVVEASVPPAPLDRPVQGGGIGLQLSASSSGGQVAISIGQSIRAADVSARQVRAVGSSWSITASAPINKNGGDTALATLDSFTDSASLKFAITRLHLTLPNLLTDPGYLGLMTDATNACITVARSKGEAAILACQEADFDENFIRTWLPDALMDYIALTTRQRSAWGYGAEGTVGYRRYSFVDSATLAKSSLEKVPWGVRGYLTWLPRSEVAITASAAYQHGFEENSSTILCPLPASGASLACITGPDGRPVAKNKVLLALDGRKIFDLSLGPLQNGVIDRIGIAPQFTWDANGKDVGLDLPVYLVPDDKGNLIGGIRFGYKSGDEGLIFGVFVGGAFNLFKR